MARAAAHLDRQIELDFIRGIALLLVMSFHYRTDDLWFNGPLMARLQNIGWAGVDLFFVLSGFLVGGLLMREWKSTASVDGWRFLKRRAFKIWPSYYVLILVAACFHLRPLRTFFWQNVLNIQNYIPTSLSHTWSLAVEEHFYLGAAALIGLWSARRWSPRALIASCLLMAVLVEIARAHAILHHQLYYEYTHLRMDALLLGVVLAALHQFEPKLFAWLRGQRVALSLFIVAVLLHTTLTTYSEDSVWTITLVDYGCVAALLLLSAPSQHQRGWLYRKVARIGIFSYGIYLWHESVLRPVDWTVAHVPSGWKSSTSTLLPYLLAIPLGVVMTKVVELPTLRLRERIVPAKTPEPALPDA